ncbi:MAG: MATE family efflux transporter [Agathobacter sp.]|nr:MATE family efflux transporter [Agathobacter sp.]
MRIFTRDKEFYKTLVILAIPIALQNFIAYAVNFIDNLMVGQLEEYVISGVYMGNQIHTLLQFAIAGVTGALTILGTQYWGKKDKESICRLTGVATRIALLFGVIITAISYIIPNELMWLFTEDTLVIREAVTYLRVVCWSYIFFCISQVLIASMQCVEKVRVGLYLSIVTLFTNVSLNYVLIFGKLGLPAMGIRGAALATVISRVIEAAVMLVYVLAVDKKLSLNFGHFFQKGGVLLRDMLRYGAPVFGGQIVWAINNLAQGSIVGHLSVEAISSISIAGNLNMLLFMIVIGFGVALGIITGKTVGAGKYEKMKEYAITSQVLFVLVGVFLGAVLFLLRKPYLSLYELSPETIEVANQFIIVLAVALVGRCYQATTLSGLVKAGGDTGFVFKMDIIFVFLIVLPSAIIAQTVFHAPAWVVYLCLQSDQIIKCFVALVKINRFNWMKNLTREMETAPQSE